MHNYLIHNVFGARIPGPVPALYKARITPYTRFNLAPGSAWAASAVVWSPGLLGFHHVADFGPHELSAGDRQRRALIGGVNDGFAPLTLDDQGDLPFPHGVPFAHSPTISELT